MFYTNLKNKIKKKKSAKVTFGRDCRLNFVRGLNHFGPMAQYLKGKACLNPQQKNVVIESKGKDPQPIQIQFIIKMMRNRGFSQRNRSVEFLLMTKKTVLKQ